MDKLSLCPAPVINEKSLKIKRLISETSQYFQDYKTIKHRCREHYEKYFKLCLDYRERKDEMIDNNFLQFLLNDIISTGEYTLEGIAYYIRITLDDIIDIFSGLNRDPSYQLVFQLIELHRSVRPEYYINQGIDL
jgi:hypothetical protein